MAAENEWPKSDGDVFYASEANQFNFGVPFRSTLYGPTNAVSILMHTTSAWGIINGTSTFITTDSGANFTNATADAAAMTGATVRCEGTRANGISFDHNANDGYITSDSSDNWAQMTTPPAAVTKTFDVSYPTSAVAVCGVDLGAAARGIFRSTDGGDNWVICTSGPAAGVANVSMYSATHGFAVDSAGNIWYTTDGGDNWTDTTFGVPPRTNSHIRAISATEYVFLLGNNGNAATGSSIHYGTNAVTISTTLDFGNGTMYATNFVVTDTGYIYIAVFRSNDDNAAQRSYSAVTLYRSTDDGQTWEMGQSVSLDLDVDIQLFFTRSTLAEHTGQIVLVGGTRSIIKFNEVYSGAV